MRTIRTKIYQFNELNEKAQEKALNELRSINVDFDWWTFTYDDAENIGLKITGFDLDRNRHAKGYFMQESKNTADRIMTEHGENCETYKTAKQFINFWDEAVKIYSDGITIDKVKEGSENNFDEYIEDKENDFLKSLLEDYSIMLQNECDDLQSDEIIKDTILANEYEFTKDGKQF